MVFFDWAVIMEKVSINTWVGVCPSKGFNFDRGGFQHPGCVIGTDGSYSNLFSNTDQRTRNYCPPFGDGAKITVHLDMNRRTLAFTVNGKKYPEVPAWKNIPSKLYPMVALYYPGRVRIQSYRKV